MLKSKTKEEYYLKVSAISTIFLVLGIIVAIKMKKGFWPIVGYSFIGSMLGSGIGYLIVSKPEAGAEDLRTSDTLPENIYTRPGGFGYNPSRT